MISINFSPKINDTFLKNFQKIVLEGVSTGGSLLKFYWRIFLRIPNLKKIIEDLTKPLKER